MNAERPQREMETVELVITSAYLGALLTVVVLLGQLV